MTNRAAKDASERHRDGKVSVCREWNICFERSSSFARSTVVKRLRAVNELLSLERVIREGEKRSFKNFLAVFQP
jgi:hypothetical protein